MPRPFRIHVPGGFYHTTLRGNHREDIFRTDSDRLLLNTIVELALARHGARIHAYCWMSNHLHMLVQVDKDPLANLMRRIASGYARAFQVNRNTTGHLFEKRYHCVLVDADAYLLELIRYIHLNPVRAGIVKRAHLYRWSSHHAYSGINVDSWVSTDFGLRMFADNRPRALAAYRQFLNCDATQIPSPLAEIQPDRPHILGSDEFAARVTKVPGAPGARRSLDSLIAEGCERHHLSREDIRSGERRAVNAQVRAWVARHAVALGIATITEVGRALDCDPKSIRNALRDHPAGNDERDLNPKVPVP